MSASPIKKQKLHQNKKKYFHPYKKQYLEVGNHGFLATCNFNEKDCIRECYNILNHYANELYGPEENDMLLKNIELDKTAPNVEACKKDDNSDIVDDLQKQIDSTKQQSKKQFKKRFQVVDTGAVNCIFIKTTLEDPVKLGTHVIKDIAQSKQQRTRFLSRLIPIECVCKANYKDIVDGAGALCDKYFLKNPSTFAIIYKKRYNHELKMDSLIPILADLIHTKNVGNKVNLEHPKKSLILEVIKGLCCITVVEDYRDYKKYNLIELCRTPTEMEKEHPEKLKNGVDADVNDSATQSVTTDEN